MTQPDPVPQPEGFITPQAIPDTTPPETSNHGLHAVSSRNFLRFWTGQTLAQFGTRLAAVAMPVLAVQLLQATEEQVGFLNASQTAAFLLVGLPAGAWVDRWLKRRTMIAADAVRFAAAFAIPVLWFADALEVWHLYIVAAVVGLATVFFDVAYQSFIPILVPDGDVASANSRLETTAQLATTGGPALGGLLLHVISAPVLLLADALGYLTSLVFLVLTKDTEHLQRDVTAPRTTSLLAEIVEGGRFVWQQPAIRRITMSTFLANLASTMSFTLLPILVLRQIGLTPFTYGLIMTAGSIGGTIGAATAPWLARRLTPGRLIPLAVLVSWITFLGNPLAGTVASRGLAITILIATEIVTMMAVMAYNITQVSIRQRLCPKPLLGRMNASIRFVVWGVMPIGALLSGWLGGRIGVLPTMWLAAIGGVVALLPVLRIARHIPPEFNRPSTI